MHNGAGGMLYSRVLWFLLKDSQKTATHPLKTWPSNRRAVEAEHSTVR